MPFYNTEMDRIGILLMFVIAIGTDASLFNRNKMTTQSSNAPKPGLQGNQESLHQSLQNTASKNSLKGHLETVGESYDFLLQDVGEILLVVDNIAVEDTMLEEMDDRLILLYKYYEEDIDQLLTYCKQVTDTDTMAALKSQGNLDLEEEFIITDSLEEPDENVKGDWATIQDLLW